MIVTLAFWRGDVALAKDLLTWINQLGGVEKHEIVLVADSATEWVDCLNCLMLARASFKHAEFITNDSTVVGWIPGSNSLWLTAARYCERRNEPFLFLEPDSAPLRKTWLDEIDRETVAAIGADIFYLGSLIDDNRWGKSGKYLEGCAVYDSHAFSDLKDCVKDNESWTLSTKEMVLPWAADSKLFHHIWGEPGNPPTFADKQIPGTNVFSLAQIPKEAVLFHRNKDGTLIRLLRKKMGIRSDGDRIGDLVIMFSFCEKDWHLMLAQMQWLKILDGRIPITAILHADNLVRASEFSPIEMAAKQVFDSVMVSRYAASPISGWPAAANWAFQHGMEYIANRVKKPWLWYEADVVAVKKGWLTRMWDEYRKCGKPLMGPIVKAWDGLQGTHFNGTPTIYPPVMKLYSRAAFTCSAQAFDTAIKDELGTAGVAKICHDSSEFVIHCGAVKNGCCKPANGELPKFPDQETVDRLIPPTCILFHPAKNYDLVERLNERLK